MWIFSKAGFYSAVAHFDNDKIIVVRARVRKDINRLRSMYMPELGETIASPKNDYPFRAMVTKKHFAEGLANLALDIDYGNFKSMIMKVQGIARETIYASVWAVMLKLEQMHVTHPQNRHAPSGVSWLKDCSPEELAELDAKGYLPTKKTYYDEPYRPDPNVIPGKDVIRSKYIYRNGRQYVRDQYGNEELVQFDPVNKFRK